MDTQLRCKSNSLYGNGITFTLCHCHKKDKFASRYSQEGLISLVNDKSYLLMLFLLFCYQREKSWWKSFHIVYSVCWYWPKYVYTHMFMATSAGVIMLWLHLSCSTCISKCIQCSSDEGWCSQLRIDFFTLMLKPWGIYIYVTSFCCT